MIEELLGAEHRKMDAFLAAGTFDEFRRMLLRHIGLEEKILLPAARGAHGGARPAAEVDLAALVGHPSTRGMIQIDGHAQTGSMPVRGFNAGSCWCTSILASCPADGRRTKFLHRGRSVIASSAYPLT